MMHKMNFFSVTYLPVPQAINVVLMFLPREVIWAYLSHCSVSLFMHHIICTWLARRLKMERLICSGIINWNGPPWCEVEVPTGYIGICCACVSISWWDWGETRTRTSCKLYLIICWINKQGLHMCNVTLIEALNRLDSILKEAKKG